MQLKINFQKTGLVPSDPSPVIMKSTSLSIGRGDENDIELPDPERTISKNHCTIENRSGTFVILDISTNGTFLNYGKIPIGKNPTNLNDGDILTLGPYEISLDIYNPDDELETGFTAQSDQMINVDPLINMDVNNVFDEIDDPGSEDDFLDDLISNDPFKQKKLKDTDLLEEEIDILKDLDKGQDDILSNSLIPEDIEFDAPVSNHSPSAHDSFNPSSLNANMIPDDWDEEFTIDPKGDLSPQMIEGKEVVSANSITEESQPKSIDIDSEVGNEANGSSINNKMDIEEENIDIFGTVGLELSSEVLNDDLIVSNSDQNNVDDANIDNSGLGVGGEADLVLTNSVASADKSNSVTVAESVLNSVQETDSGTENFNSDLAIKAFVKGLGIEDLMIKDVELTDAMNRIGIVCRNLITGVREILMTRTSIKNEFKMEQTRIGAGGNNPLKFSVSADEAIKSLVLPASKGYLGSDKASEEAVRDIKAHEIAMITGMEAALKGVLERLSPKQLELEMEKSGNTGGLLKGKKARYWEIYEKMYSEISDQAENEFHNFFSKEFSKAYEEQLERLK